tara:strand:+ start:461 stop:1072 length:612 start_codon:yes stop_codon:yes gene_type:complete
MKSLSEIETIAKRASRAAGFSWGIAEEIGKSIRLLELFGLPGIKNLNQYFYNKDQKKFESIKLIHEKNEIKKFSYCPITLGIGFIDQAKKLENLNKFHFQDLAYPLLLLPFLSRCSEIIGKKVCLSFDDYNFVLNFNIKISSNYLKEDFPSRAKNVQVNFLDNKDTFNDEDWKKLYKLSENTFVEETDSLKEGAAGAGLTDND